MQPGGHGFAVYGKLPALSTLYLIRHGQASFGAEDYDVLSDLGIEQGRQLGSYWARRGPALDACYVGPRRRHVGTAEGFARGAREAGKEYPSPIASMGSTNIRPSSY